MIIAWQSMDDLFTDADNAEVHPIYAAIRDSEWLCGDKSRLEAMWEIYHTYADKHFLREIKTNFIQRYWEMATTLALLQSGYLLRSEDAGPEIVVIDGDDTPLLYVECVAPTVAARKDDAPAAYRAAITNLAGLALFSGGGGLIQTTSG